MSNLLNMGYNGRELTFDGTYRIKEWPIDTVIQKIFAIEDYLPDLPVNRNQVQITQNGDKKYVRYNTFKATISIDVELENNEINITQTSAVVLAGQCNGVCSWKVREEVIDGQTVVVATLKGRMVITGLMGDKIVTRLAKFYPLLVSNLLNRLKHSNIQFNDGQNWLYF